MGTDVALNNENDGSTSRLHMMFKPGTDRCVLQVPLPTAIPSPLLYHDPGRGLLARRPNNFWKLKLEIK